MDTHFFLDYIELPNESRKPFVFYRIANDIGNNNENNLKILWQRDLECEIEDETWLNIVSSSGRHIR